MRVIRPYGQTVTSKNNPNRQLDPLATNLPRPMDPSADNLKRLMDIAEHHSTVGKALIAQWISVIDKIFRKPNQNDAIDKGYESKKINAHKAEQRITERIDFKDIITKNDNLRKTQIDARKRLGAACWPLIEQLLAEDERTPEKCDDLKKIWDWKLNPAGSDARKFKNDRFKNKGHKQRPYWVFDKDEPLIIRGRWYKRFLQNRPVENIDFDQLAKQIYAHLHEHEMRQQGGYRTFRDHHSNQMGLIESRARSIALNTPQNRMKSMLGLTSTGGAQNG